MNLAIMFLVFACSIVFDRVVVPAIQRKRRAKLPPNQVDGMILPFANDPRWRRIKCTKTCGGKWKIRAIEVCDDHGLYIGGDQVNTEQANRYVNRVLQSQRERLALSAALDERRRLS